MPLELYPPVMNLIEAWGKYNKSLPMDVYTTRADQFVDRFNGSAGNIHIHRYGKGGKGYGFIRRLIHYLFFYLFTFLKLIITRPGKVLYYDSISSFPAVLYKRYINRKCRLFVHYNEYMSPDEYRDGMFLVRYFHRLEKKIYGNVSWLSHTNEARMKLFLLDLNDIEIPYQHILPNFPPVNWSTGKARGTIGMPARIVYIGALAMDTMYTRLFAEWVLKQKGAVTWDIYSLNVTDDVKDYIHSLPAGLITLHDGVDYYTLPPVLRQYDIGVILYNGHIPNYIYNAPNKLFEYAVCGLDVWFPGHMKSSYPYVTKETYPRIVPLDFASIEEMDAAQLINRNGYIFRQSRFSCEEVLLPLFEELSA